jgi:hypothetical protein
MIQINLDIPGYIKEAELRFLGALVKGLPENSILLDIGCGWGREGWVFAKNAPASAQVFCVDTWAWPPTWKYLYKGTGLVPESERTLKNSRAEFEACVKDCPNITAVQGDKKIDWDGPAADFIFYDEEDEVEEIILPKLRHWLEKLKPG